MDDLPYLLADQPPIPAVFKARWEDFRVAEIPAVEPEGRGDHTWFEIEKSGLTTTTAVADLARALGVRPSTLGVAGLKDARSISRQWLSVEHVDPDRLLSLSIPRIRVLRAVRHPRKLRRGWHAGNRFEVRLRANAAGSSMGDRPGVSGPGGPGEPLRAALLLPRLDVLRRRGVPNYYGPQRFGTRGDTWRIGRALARERWEEAASLIAGRPLRPDDPAVDPALGVHPDTGDIRRARERFDAGEFRAAAAAWPRGFGAPARLAEAMERTGGDAARSLPVVGKRMLRLYASAWQARLFNAVLARRIESLDRLLPGDLAWKHDTEALFLVDDTAAEQPRAERFELSPTGPLVGKRMREPEGVVRQLEEEALRDAGWEPADLHSAAMRPLTGRRRPLRFHIDDVDVADDADGFGPCVTLRFALPPGCYATAVLRELGRGGIVEAARESAASQPGGEGGGAAEG